MKFRCCLAVAATLGLLADFNAAGAAAILQGKIRDALTGEAAPCTVRITDANGKVITESESFRAGFRCSGEFIKALPAGPTRIRITRGFETKAVEREINLVPGKTNSLECTLERIVNLRQRGWYAGDSHVHMLHGERTVPVEFDFVGLSARAEDLQYLSLAQAWNIDQPIPERLEAELRRRSTPNCLLTWNLEAPKNYYKGDAGRCLGHCWTVGVHGRRPKGEDVIQMLLAASAWDYESSKPTYANFESHRLIHEQGGVVCYSHPARWWMGPWGGQGGYPRREQMRVSNMAVELPLDTLLGPTYDGLDIITGSGEFEANAKAFELWCMLLNHGYRIAPTGSSDSCFDRPGGGVPGTPRTYTFVVGKFTLAKAAQAIAAGRTFVTTGPLLVATINGDPPGTTFTTGMKTRKLSVETWASGRTQGGLERLEILRNGKVWRECALGGTVQSFRTNFNILEGETSWYCVRVSGPERQQAVSGAFNFAEKSFRPPAPVPAQVRVKVIDAQTGDPIAAVLTEMAFAGASTHPGARHRLQTGEEVLCVPGTVRLRAEAKGYAPMTLSPILDSPELINMVTTFNDVELSDWQTFEKLKRQLACLELVFRLQRTSR